MSGGATRSRFSRSVFRAKSDTCALPSKQSRAKTLHHCPLLLSGSTHEYSLNQLLHQFPRQCSLGPRALVQTGSSALQSLLPYKPAQLCPTQNAAAKNVFLACQPDNSNPSSDAPPPSQLYLLHNLTLLILNKAVRRRADSFLISLSSAITL